MGSLLVNIPSNGYNLKFNFAVWNPEVQCLYNFIRNSKYFFWSSSALITGNNPQNQYFNFGTEYCSMSQRSFHLELGYIPVVKFNEFCLAQDDIDGMPLYNGSCKNKHLNTFLERKPL